MSRISLAEIAEEFLDSEYELDTTVDRGIPSIEWKQDKDIYSLKVYSEEFLESDSRAVAGKTLENVVKREVEEENDLYIEVRVPGEGFTPERAIYPFSEEEIDEGLRQVFSYYVEDY